MTWLTVGEAAKQLGISGTDVYRLVDAGRLPAHQKDNRMVFRPEDLDAFQAAAST